MISGCQFSFSAYVIEKKKDKNYITHFVEIDIVNITFLYGLNPDK